MFPLLLLAGLIAIILWGGSLAPRSFDAVEWRAMADEDVRLRMVDSLMSSGRLDKLARAEVLALLGTPSDTRQFPDWDLVYRLGMERSLLSIDSEWLAIDFGADGTVARYRVVRD